MKKSTVVDLRVEIEPPRYAYGYSNCLETKAKDLEAWADDLQNFIRDHRSQDDVVIRVIKDKHDICSFCQSEWEIDFETGLPVCCGEAIEEFEAAAAIAKATN